MHDDSKPHSDFERFTQEQKAVMSAKREARQIKAGEIEHPWLRTARQSKESADRSADTGEWTGSEADERARVRVRTALLFFGLAVLLPACVLFLVQPSAAPEPPPPAAITLWYAPDGENGERELEQVQKALDTIEPAVDLVPARDMRRSLQIALLRAEQPDVAIVDHRTAVELRDGNRLAVVDSVGTQAFFPLADSAPFGRPMILVVLKTGRSEEESARVLAFARELHRRLRAAATGSPESQS